jgi:hypothetical protein
MVRVATLYAMMNNEPYIKLMVVLVKDENDKEVLVTCVKWHMV